MRSHLFAWFPVVLVASVVAAQQPRATVKAELVGRFHQLEFAYANVWGEGSVAYLCHFGDAGVDVIDVGDPFNPAWITEIRPDSPNDGASAQEAKGGNGLLFVALEGDGHDGVLIVDIRDPMNPIKKSLISTPGYADVHDLFYDDRILYLSNSRTPQVGIVDLTDYDPDLPPARITSALWTLNGVGNSMVHDVAVFGGRLYAYGWNSGVLVYDIAGIRRRAPQFITSVGGTATHSGWMTSDGKHLAVGEERQNGGIKVYEFRPPSQTGQGALILRSSLVLPSSEAYSVHNQVIVGNRMYNAWYQAGLKVHDINPATGAIALVAEYDTFSDPSGGFDGAWGVYPFMGEDRILVSDISNGLFVIDISGVPKIHFLHGLPDSVNPVVPTPLTVRVLHEAALADTDPVLLHLTVAGRGGLSIPMTRIESGIYSGAIPPIPCGSIAEFYITATTTGGQTIAKPQGAPNSVYTLISTTSRHVALADGFEIESAWTVGASGDTATSGVWTRGNPTGTSAQPENDSEFGQGTKCWFTGQGTHLSLANSADVDGGSTTLLSPIFDGTLPNSFVGYSRWFSNHLGGSPVGDTLAVSISNNGGGNWTPLEFVSLTEAAWIPVTFRIADYITPTTQMRLRFVASDVGGDSLVEAAIDDFVVFQSQCREVAGDTNGDGLLNLEDSAELPACLTGPDLEATAVCLSLDFDLDLDVDLVDVAEMVRAFEE